MKAPSLSPAAIQEAPERSREASREASSEEGELFNPPAVCEWGQAIFSIQFAVGETETQTPNQLSLGAALPWSEDSAARRALQEDLDACSLTGRGCRCKMGPVPRIGRGLDRDPL